MYSGTLLGWIEMRIGCLGPVGTFSEAAARQLYRGANHELILLPSISAVFRAATERQVDVAVVPLKNTLAGDIQATAEGFITYTNVRPIAQIVLPVRQHLLSLPGAELSAIAEVWSNPAALTQCAKWLARAGVLQRQVASTAEAARRTAAAGRPEVAAIASEFAAERYGLAILLHDLQDTQANETTFVSISVVGATSQDDPG